MSYERIILTALALFLWQFNLHEECLYPGFVAHFNDLWFTARVDGGIFIFFMEMSAIKRGKKIHIWQ